MKTFRVFVFIGMLALVFGAVFAWTNSDGSVKTPSDKTDAVKITMPIDLAGKWESTTSKAGTKMIGEVKDNTIFVQMYTNDGYTGLWYGTFDILQPGQNTVVSKFIEDNQDHFALSTAETKEFLYQKGSLIFDYSVMGSVVAVEMKRV